MMSPEQAQLRQLHERFVATAPRRTVVAESSCLKSHGRRHVLSCGHLQHIGPGRWATVPCLECFLSAKLEENADA